MVVVVVAAAVRCGPLGLSEHPPLKVVVAVAEVEVEVEEEREGEQVAAA